MYHLIILFLLLEKCLAESRNDYLKKLTKSQDLINKNDQEETTMKVIEYKNISLTHEM